MLLGAGLLILAPSGLSHGVGTASELPTDEFNVQHLTNRTVLANSLGAHEATLAFASPVDDGTAVGIWVQQNASGEAREVSRIDQAPDDLHIDSLGFDGRYVAWSDNRTGSLQVYLADTEEGSFQALTRSNSDERQVRIHDGMVVWSSWGSFTVHAYDIEEDRRFRVGGGGGVGPASAPDVYEDKVVWSRSTGGASFDIFLRNLTTGEISQLSDDDLVQATPRIWGDLVVWAEGSPPDPMEGADGDGDPASEGSRIKAHDLASNTTVILSPGYGPFKRPLVASQLAAWEIHPAGLAVHGLASGQSVVIPAQSNATTDIALSDELVAFSYRGPGGSHVLGAHVEDLLEPHDHGTAGSVLSGDLALGGLGALLLVGALGIQAWKGRGG